MEKLASIKAAAASASAPAKRQMATFGVGKAAIVKARAKAKR